ncbi:MAG: efflux RND transporter periplasmic adaptor subunit [Phycisphaerae bacterium]|jgi:membrane fusion protein (multidrug efflux system)
MAVTPGTQSEQTSKARGWGRRVVPALLLVVVAGLVGVVALMPSDPAPVPPVVAVPVNVTVETVALEDVKDALTLTAVVEPNRVVRVAAEVAGRIERYGESTSSAGGESTPLVEGEQVQKGQAIIHLNKDLLQARYDQALAQADYDDREYQRQLDLYERAVGSKTELDDARTRREVSRAALEGTEHELARTTICAPQAGVLNKLPREVGEYVTPGDEVAEIVEVDTVKVVVNVPERDVRCFQVGQEAELVPFVEGQAALVGEITYVSALADEGTRTTRLEITADNRKGLLRSGQIINARLIRQQIPGTIMIPLAAVIPLEVGHVVYVVNDEHAERRDVVLGLLQGRRVQVLSGLAPGDRLIVAGHRYVGPGQPVDIVDAEPTP